MVCLDGEFPDEGWVGVPDVDVVNSGDTIGCEENVSGLEVFCLYPFAAAIWAVGCPEEVVVGCGDGASVGEGDVGDLVGVEVGPLVGDLPARPFAAVGVVGNDKVAWADVFDVFVGAVCLEDLDGGSATFVAALQSASRH